MTGLTIYCQQLEPNLLRVADITPADDDYPAVKSRGYWLLSLFRNGRLLLQTSTDDARNRPWTIDSRDFGIASFDADVYSVRVELWGFAQSARKLADYFIRTPLGINQSVWARKNGAYYNITSEGSLLDDGDFEWSKLGTYDDYETYQLRSTVAGSIIRTEKIIENVLQYETYDDTGKEVVLLAGEQSRVFVRDLRLLWAQAWLKQVRIRLGTAVVNNSTLSREDADLKLRDVGADLDELEMGLLLDENLVQDTIKLIKAGLQIWTN